MLLEFIRSTSFHIVAVSVTLMAIVFNLIEGNTDKTQNKVFTLILFDVLISGLAAIACIGLEPLRTVSDFYYKLSFASHILYFSSHSFLAPLFYMYVRRVIGALDRDKGLGKHVVTLIPFFISEIAICTNPFTKWVFYYGEDAVFNRNWGESVIYISSALYFVLAVFSIFYYWSAINERRKYSLTFSFVLVITGVLVQLFFKEVQIELQMEAFALLGIMFSIEKEDDRIDAVLKTYNRGALRMDLNNFFKMRRKFAVLCLRIEDTEYAKKAAFTSDPDMLMKPVAEYLRTVLSRYQIYRPGPESFLLVSLNPEELAKEISERFEESWNYEGGDIRLKCTILYAYIPDELDNEEGVMLLSDAALGDRERGDILCGERLALLTREGKVGEAIKRGLQDRNFDIFYQPVYRLSDKKIHFAETTIKLVDDEIGTVSFEEFLPVAKKNGVAEEIFYLLFEEICIFLGSGIPTEMGLKGFSVVVPVFLCEREEFLSHILELIEKYDIKPENINIELLEGRKSEDFERLPVVIRGLKLRGFAVTVQGLKKGAFRYGGFTDSEFDMVSMLFTDITSEKGNLVHEKMVCDFIDMIKSLGKTTLVRGGYNSKQISRIDELKVDFLESDYYSEAIRQNEFISIIRMTEAARLEEQRAIAGSEAKSNFLANMSHEIRTPINAILGMNEMILRECDDPTILSYARDIESAGRSLVSLINDILDFSKIEAGSIDISNAAYSVSGLISDVCNMLRVRYASSSIGFIVKVDPTLPKRVIGDEMRIRQVMINLLNNAFKYTNDGSVTLSVKRDDNAKGFILVIEVTDTGIGIKEEDMDKLFGTFVRLELERNKSIEGSGLGLAITKNLVERMGGEVSVKSTYGKGSTFKIAIPQKVVDNDFIGEFSEDKKDEFPALKQKRDSFVAKDASILVVDDTPINLKVISRLLRHTQINVDTCKSGKEAIELSAGKKYDIIFLDYRMPEMDGVETLKEIKKDTQGINHDTPVIVLTANALSGARERFLADGFDDYLSKPVEAAFLEEMILEYLPAEKVDAADADAGVQGASSGYDFHEIRRAGVDTKAGKDNCGSEEDYIEALRDYASSGLKDVYALREYLDNGDFENFTIRVHSIKSISRMIGAYDIGNVAERLENAGEERDEEYILDRIPAFLVDLVSLSEAIVKMAGLPEKSAEEIIDENEGKNELPDMSVLDEAFAAIREFADNADQDNVAFVLDTLSDYRLPPDILKNVENIRKFAEDFKWEEVSNELDRIHKDIIV